MTEGISIVIVSHNSEKVIEQTLNCLFNQSETENINWEIVFVNNNSNDNTIGIVEGFQAKNPFKNLTLFHEARIGVAYGRFTGFEKAKYDKICFVDDDNRMPTHWIKTLNGIMKNENIGILGCGAKGSFETKPPEWFEKNSLAYAVGNIYTTDSLLDVTVDGNLPTAGMCIRKQVYLDLMKFGWKSQLTGRQGVKVQIPGEDTELCQAARLIGYKIYYTNQLTFEHFMVPGRLVKEKLLDMTHGFGMSDVFLLPYKLIYDKNVSGINIKYQLRKLWWVNYLGKKISLLKHQVNFKLGQIEPLDFEIIKVRINGFCEAILANKNKFNQVFADVNKLVVNYNQKSKS